MKKISLLLLTFTLCACERSPYSVKGTLNKLKSSKDINIDYKLDHFITVHTTRAEFKFHINNSGTQFFIDDIKKYHEEENTDNQIKTASEFLEKYYFIDKDKMEELFLSNSSYLRMYKIITRYNLFIKVPGNQFCDYSTFEYTASHDDSFLTLEKYTHTKDGSSYYYDENNLTYFRTN